MHNSKAKVKEKATSSIAHRPCDKCKHYVVKDAKLNYEQNGCGTRLQKIYGCELWECDFNLKGNKV